MVGIRHRNIVGLRDVIVPQCIYNAGSNILVFDKINLDEGRLYKLDIDSESVELIMEVDDGECFFGRDGCVYLLYTNEINETSTIEIYDYQGLKKKDINFDGVLYYLDIDENGFIYSIYSEEDGMSIRIFDNNGIFVRIVHSRNMPLFSAIHCDNEYIYAGGFSDDIPLRIEKLNCLSYILNTFDFDIDKSKLIVSKILKHGKRLFLILSGGIQEKIYTIDEEEGSIQEIYIPGIKLNIITDIDIFNNNLYILSDKKIIVCDLDECGIQENEPGRENSCDADGDSGFGYLSYLVYIKNIHKYILNSVVKIGIPLTMMAMLVYVFWFEKKGLVISNVKTISIFIAVSCTISILSTIVHNIIITGRKRSRLDYILDIYNNPDRANIQALRNSLLIGFITFLTVSALLLGNDIIDIYPFLLSPVSGIIPAAAAYILFKKYNKKFSDGKNDIVFELLSFESDEYESLENISSLVKKLRKKGIENYKIKLRIGAISYTKMVKLINRWSDLRKNITGDRGSLKGSKEYLVFEISLKNRDIKYSRISVIEDFICYIKKSIGMSSIIIESSNDEEIVV